MDFKIENEENGDQFGKLLDWISEIAGQQELYGYDQNYSLDYEIEQTEEQVKIYDINKPNINICRWLEDRN